MNEPKMRCMKSHAGNAPLFGFLGGIFSIADHGMADCRKLHSNLVL
jgi:hypothetical protein